VGVLGLRLLGAAHVDYLVPNRFEYGYGLTRKSSPWLQRAAVADHRGQRHLQRRRRGGGQGRGLKVLVTDHHLPGDELPAADAIVNPNQPGCEFPSKALAGVGVIFYVLMALRARLRSLGWYESKQPNIGELLDLVALGSVADVVPLDANNRILVHQGLERIRAGRARPGSRRSSKWPSVTGAHHLHRPGFHPRPAPECRRAPG
jgi:single-stranded-DNA-specific exonuclease